MFRVVLSVICAAMILVATIAQAQPERRGPARGPQMAAQPNIVRGDEINDAQRKAVERGLARLATRQRPDGTFGAPNDGVGAQTAATALAGLAFMESGSLPGRGLYGEQTQRCVNAILAGGQQSGLLVSEAAQAVMYSHGFATLFLAEVYGMTGDEQVKDKLQRAVQLIEKTQNEEGGWRYQPAPVDADISVTICQVMALRAARDAGIKVNKQVIDKAIEYVRRCQNPDGGFNYRLDGGGSAFPRSAAGVAALYYAGVFEGDDIRRGLQYVRQFTPGRDGGASNAHYFYGQYYAVQTMFLAGGDYWAEWFPAIRDELVQRQDRNTGAWSGEVSEEYCTAVALIILQIPNRYLPVFNGKGPGG